MPTSPFPETDYMNEDYRPQFHYTAEKNMINDPNGLVYYEGEFHLFHQYNLHEAIHWGHAVSPDLVHWEHLPPAIFPDLNGQVYSGTAVVDRDNTSGLQTGRENVLVAAFTHADHHTGSQSQGIAYSNDKGRTWNMYAGNPALPNPGTKDFRDPKIFWHEPEQRWCMLLTAGSHLEFYHSEDLLHWDFTSSWGKEHGSHDGVWECPDIFELTVDGTTETRWVISVSVDRGAPAGGSGMQYFVGTYDGTTFSNENPADTVLWQNYGKDYYAGITWSNVPATDGRTLMIAWVDNWLYRFDPPTTPFNGQLSLVRELRLQQFPEGHRLTQNPVDEQTNIRQSAISYPRTTIHPDGDNIFQDTDGETLEILAEFDLETSTAAQFGIDVRVGGNQFTRIGYDSLRREVYLDRSHSGLNPSPHWAGRHSCPADEHHNLRLRIFVDRSSIEVFINEREQISDLVLPDRASIGLRTFATDGVAQLTSATIYSLERIWETKHQSQWKPISGEWAETTLGLQGSARGNQIGITVEPELSEDTNISAEITILRAAGGNPQTILGERSGGLALRYDPNTGDGFFVTIEAREQHLSVNRRLAGTEHVLERMPLPIQPNQPVHLSAQINGLKLAVAVNGKSWLEVTDNTLRAGHAALWVSDAEAVFTNVTTTASSRPADL
jgi:fructan beta-fructosidase